MQSIDLTLPKISGRLEQFDEIKGIGIALLMLFHAGGVLVWNNYLHGDLGTDIFFLISGCVLALNASRMGVREFAVRRLVRILPAYWIVLTGYIVLNEGILQVDYSRPNLLAHYLGMHALFGDAWGFAIDDAFWFITAILLFYACFLLMRSLLSRVDTFLLIAAAISTGAAMLLYFLGQSGLTGRWGFRMIDFFLGMLIGQGLRAGQLKIPLTPTLGLALLVLLYVPYSRGIVFHPVVVALGVIGAYLFGLRPWMGRNGRERRFIGTLGWLGRHSLEIFLIHQPLMREYNRYAYGHWLGVTEPSEGQLIFGIAVSVVVTLILSAELHRFTSWLVRRLPLKARTGAGDSLQSSGGHPQLEFTGRTGEPTILDQRKSEPVPVRSNERVEARIARQTSE